MAFGKVRESLGRIIGKAFFFPLHSKAAREKVQEAETFVKNWWNRNQPLDPNFRKQFQVRRKFTVSDKTVTTTINGKTLTLSYRVVERKGSSKKGYNFVQIPGNTSNSRTGILFLYPFLAAFLKLQKEEPDLKSGRFITISEYDLKDASGNDYSPSSLDESGLILKDAMSKIVNRYGKINHVLCHSLGSILYSAAQKYMDGKKAEHLIPKNICFDRGPTSIELASKKYWYGSLIIPFAWFTGWLLNLENAIIDFCKKWPHITKVVSGVVEDHHFYGPAGLCNSAGVRTLQKEKKIKLLIFDPKGFHEMAHHSLRNDYFNKNYLIKPSNDDFMEENETFAHTLLRHSVEA